MILITINCYSQSKTKIKETNKFQEILDIYSDSLQLNKYGIVNLTKHQNKIFKSEIGWSSETEKMTSNKIFNIGSLTKLFTSVLILQEIENGKLKLNDTIGSFFLENKNVDSKITIEQLLRHQSGLGEIAVDSVLNNSFVNYEYKYNHCFLYNQIPNKQFNKGEKFLYTNTNYQLLGYILEIINDEPYSKIVEERIFKPCKMKNSYTYFSKTLKNIAHPMFNGEDLIKQVNYKFYYNLAFSAGCISSNLNDLELFFSSLYETNKLISRETFIKMTEFQDDYGLGIQRIKVKSKNKEYYLIGHSGDNISFKIRNWYNPKTKDLIITISNQMGEKYIGKINNEIIKDLE
mgnify:CR=1 FL=1